MKRREFIKLSGWSTGSVLAGSTVLAFLASCRKHDMGGMNMNGEPVEVIEGAFTKLLPIPQEATATAPLTAQAVSANISGNNVAALGYSANGILGPTIRLNQGGNVNINFRNALSEKTNIHWHGLKIPAAMDGHPESIVNAGSSFNFLFPVTQRAALCWYHPHADGTTAKQVANGLAGLFIINDSEESSLNLPSGSNELPLVIQDKKLTASGIQYNPAGDEIMTGYIGETVMVNGAASPYAEVATRYYRLRILNGSNARIYNLALSNNANFVVIGNEGGLLPQPVSTKFVLLSPGERLDVLVNFAGQAVGSEVFLESRAFTGAGTAQGQQSFRIMKFKVTQQVNDSFVVPSTLSTITPLSASAASRTRTFTLDVMQMSGGMNMGGMHQINGKVYDAMRIDETVAAGALELWEFDNQTDEPHPMHLHGVQFQVLQRTGGRNQLLPSEGGWKDTVLLLPKEKVRILVPFGNERGVFVMHCHNLEHEEDGMMLQFEIV